MKLINKKFYDERIELNEGDIVDSCYFNGCVIHCYGGRGVVKRSKFVECLFTGDGWPKAWLEIN